MKAYLACLLAILPTAAFAADHTVFGFELGKPLALQECEFKTVANTKMYDPTPRTTCFQAAHTMNGYGIPVRRIIFSQQDAPKIVKNWNLIALEAHGVLIGLRFATYGAASQELTLEQLTQKYGKPSAVSQHAVQNELGAAFNAVLAKWDLRDLSVTFEGITHSVDFGEVRIDLPEAVQMRAEWAKQETGRPL
jgi:hypothetical protein